MDLEERANLYSWISVAQIASMTKDSLALYIGFVTEACNVSVNTNIMLFFSSSNATNASEYFDERRGEFLRFI